MLEELSLRRCTQPGAGWGRRGRSCLRTKAGRINDIGRTITSTGKGCRASPDSSLSHSASPVLLPLLLHTSSDANPPPQTLSFLLPPCSARWPLWRALGHLQVPHFPSSGWVASAHASPFEKCQCPRTGGSQEPFMIHQGCCHVEVAKWSLTGHSIEPNHLYQM